MNNQDKLRDPIKHNRSTVGTISANLSSIMGGLEFLRTHPDLVEEVTIQVAIERALKFMDGIEDCLSDLLINTVYMGLDNESLLRALVETEKQLNKAEMLKNGLKDKAAELQVKLDALINKKKK